MTRSVEFTAAVLAAALFVFGTASPAAATHTRDCERAAACGESMHKRHHRVKHHARNYKHHGSHHAKVQHAKPSHGCHHDGHCGGDIHRVAAYLVRHGYIEWDHIRMKHGYWDVDDARCADGSQRDLRLDPVTLAVLDDKHGRHH
jgi:Peptidase propeptide and YPEB domain